MFGAIAGAVIGGLLAKKQAGKAQQANERLSEEQMAFQREQADREYARQKEFAQMGIRWKVDDTKAAGLHPLAALGGAGASYSPVVTAGSSAPYNDVPGVDYGAIGKAAGDLIDGQNTKRAQMATKTQMERDLEQLALERAKLQNRLLEAQITSEWANVMGQPGTPPMPGAVGAPVAPVGAIQVRPSEVVSGDRRYPGMEAGSTPAFKRHEVWPGASVDLPTSSMSEGLEALGPFGSTAGAMLTGVRALRNYWHGPSMDLPAAPWGTQWMWDPFRQGFILQGPPGGRKTGSPFRPGRGGARLN